LLGALVLGLGAVWSPVFAAGDPLQRFESLMDEYQGPAMQAGMGEELDHPGGWADKVSPLRNTNIRVNCMPSFTQHTRYANGHPGVEMVIWGNVQDGTPPYTYEWDFDDGSPPATGTVDEWWYIDEPHTYPAIGTYTATLTVTDADGDSDVDETEVRILPFGNQVVEVNIAIEKGLRWLYLQQSADGSWWESNYDRRMGATGAALLSFEENGHMPYGDPDTDIYAEWVELGMNWILGHATVTTLTGGNAVYDYNGDGEGVFLRDNQYANGMALMAVLGADTPEETIQTGPYAGRTYRVLLENSVDQFYYSQTDTGGGHGGWRYSVNSPNYGSSDNSAVQWPVLVMEQAERDWSMAIPPELKVELEQWLDYSQCGTGGFGYTYGCDNSPDCSKTGSAIAAYAFIDSSSTCTSVMAARDFLTSNWTNNYFGGWNGQFNGNSYALYAMKKGCDLSDPQIEFFGAHDWYSEYAEHLLTHGTWGQYEDGHWHGHLCTWGEYFYDQVSTGLNLLTLTPGVITQVPVGVIDALGDQPPDTPFTLNGENSFHMNPGQEIVDWRWHFGLDEERDIDWDNPDAVGPVVEHPGIPLPQGEDSASVTVTLRVEDNSEPPLVDYAAMMVLAHNGNHEPTAVLNGPWSADVGDPILVSGAGSWDPDTLALGDYIAVYEWDLDGDAEFDDFFGPETTLVYQVPYFGEIGLRVSDSFGAWSVTSEYMEIYWTYVDFSADYAALDPNPVVTGYPLHFEGQITVDADAAQVLDNVEAHFELDGIPIGPPFAFSGLVNGSVVQAEFDDVAPGTAGDYAVTFVVDTPDAFVEYDEENNVALSTLVVEDPAPEAVLSIDGIPVTEYDFGCLALGECADADVTLTNAGNIPVELLSWALNPDDPSFAVTGPAAGVLAPGDQYQYNVEFCPQVDSFFDVFFELTFDFGGLSLELLGCGESPLAVELVNFTGEQVSDGVLLSWEATAEHLGYRVLRATERDGAYLAATAEMIPGGQGVFSWRDTSVNPETWYYYRVRIYDHSGLTMDTPSIGIESGELLPAVFELSQNWPNPFNPATRLRVALPAAGELALVVYNTLGQRVTVLADGSYEGGLHEFVWHAGELSSGIYIALAEWEGERSLIRMTLIR